MAENKKSKVLYFIIFRDDDDSKKERHAYIREDDFWVYIQLVDKTTLELHGEEFRVPRERVLKIKEAKNE